jgi:acetyl-CoA acetyltransferase
VILGCAGPDAREANVARVAALRAGLPESDAGGDRDAQLRVGHGGGAAAEQRLRAGEGEVFLVGGAESMSNFPLLMGPQLVRFFTRLGKARTAMQKHARCCRSARRR